MDKRLALPESLSRRVNQADGLLNKIHSSALMIVLLILIVFFSALSNQFASRNNILLILMRTTPLAMVVAGQTFVVITGGIDLSVGSVAGLASIIAATMMASQPQAPLLPILAIGLALLAATVIGALHGWLITHEGLSPFIVTFGSMSLIKGLALIYSNASPITIPHGEFTQIWSLDSAIVPVPILLLILVFLGLSYILKNTKLGRYAFVIGNNETVAQMSGVDVKRYKTLVYALSGFLAGVSGLLLMTRLESGVYTNGESYALTSVAAVVIGGTSLRGGSGSLWGALLGVLLITLAGNGLSGLNVSSLWNAAVTGTLILVAALVDVRRRKAIQAPVSVKPDQPLASGESYLWQMFASVRQMVVKQLACDDMRLYVVDRETGDLIQQGETVEHRTIIEEQDHIAMQVIRSGSPVWIDDFSQETTLKLKPIKPHLQSAIAVPVSCSDRLIGILELQSPYCGVFNARTADQLIKLTRNIAPDIEDSWLLDSGWLLRNTRDALRHLWDEVYLGKSHLATWLYSSNNATSVIRGRELQQFLSNAIEAIHEKDPEGHTRARRQFQVLHQTYVEGLTIEEVTEKLSISRRQYFYDLKEALEALVHVIVSRKMTPLLVRV